MRVSRYGSMSHPPDSMSSMSITELAALAEPTGGPRHAATQARAHLTRKQLEPWLRDRGASSSSAGGSTGWRASPLTRWQPLRAALLAAGPDAAASHSLGRRDLGMPGVVADEPELTSPGRMWTSFPASRSHQSSYLLDHHRTVHQGFR